MSVIKQEIAVDNDATQSRGVKRELIEIELTDAEYSTNSRDYCQKMFTEKSDDTNQIICVHTNGSYKCDECEKSYVREQYLKAHKVDRHMTKCNVCGKLLRPRSLKRHIRNTHDDMKYQCNICGEIMTSKANLSFHINDIHRNQSIDAENSIYTCDYCQKLFTSKSTITHHIICVHASGSYKCDKCEKSYVCEKYLKAHKVNMHSTLMKKCNICGQLMRPHSFNRHMRNKHSDTKHQCNICGEIMMSKASLSCHMNNVHHNQPIDEENSTYTCDYCQKLFTDKSTMTRHIICVHASGSFHCDKCEKSYVCEEYLKVHKANVHSALKNKCNVCGKLMRQSNLKNHMLRAHGYTKYQCNICGEIMMSAACLNCHKNDVHLNQPVDALNTCHYCKKIYSSKRTLKFHMTKLHGNKDHRCSNCTVDFKREHRIRNNLKSEYSKGQCEESDQQITYNKSEKENGLSTHHTIDKSNIMDSASLQQHEVIGMKKEPVEEILDAGPVVFQHMDHNYRPLKEEPLFHRFS